MKYLVTVLLLTMALQAEKLQVVTVTSDLASITDEVGGKFVKAQALIPATDNPHKFLPQESHLKKVNSADLFVINGMDLEVLWLNDFLKKSTNDKININNPGYLDPSKIIQPEVISKGTFTKLSGRGAVKVNPHYLTDPVNGILAAQMISSKLKVLLPEESAYLNAKLDEFQMKLLKKLIGKKQAEKYHGKIDRLVKLNRFLKVIDEVAGNDDTGGWFKDLRPLKNKQFLVDHKSYTYLLKRFQIKTVDALEQFPGFPPGKRHIDKICRERNSSNTVALVTSPWFDKKVIDQVIYRTKLPQVKLLHQTGSGGESETYLKTIEKNIDKLAEVAKLQPAEH